MQRLFEFTNYIFRCESANNSFHKEFTIEINFIKWLDREIILKGLIKGNFKCPGKMTSYYESEIILRRITIYVELQINI